MPAGMVKITLHGFDLVTPSLCYGVIKVGPHWGRTTTIAAATKATWNWEVSLTAALPTYLLCAWTLLLPVLYSSALSIFAPAPAPGFNPQFLPI